jgi:hypothetical protein
VSVHFRNHSGCGGVRGKWFSPFRKSGAAVKREKASRFVKKAPEPLVLRFFREHLDSWPPSEAAWFGTTIALFLLEVKILKAAAPRPSQRRDPVRFRSLAVLLVPSVLLVTVFAIREFTHSAAAARSPIFSLAANWQSAFDFNTPVESRRPVFPYSVISGGVANAKELTSAVAKDPVVARHYADFQLDKAHTIRLDRPTSMYVSYRLNDRIYWTRNTMLIPAGETLISDGENLARVRCGNRLSMIAAKPVSLSEPPREMLEAPAFIPPLLADLAPRDGAEPIPPLPVPLAALPLLPPGPGTAPGPTVVVFPPILPPGVTGPGHSFIPPPVLPVPTPGVSTPEPAASELLLAGALLLAAGALLRK